MANVRVIMVCMLFLCCFLSLLSNSVQAELDSTYISSHCEASEAYLGEAANITCHFSKDLQQHNKTFRMYRASFTDTKQDIILECYRPGFGRLDCKPIPSGFEFDNKISDKVTVTIPIASLELVGKYECRAEPSYPHMIKGCTLMVKSKPVSSTTTPSLLITSGELDYGATTEGKGVNVAVLAISLIITVITFLFVGMALYLLRHRILNWCFHSKNKYHLHTEDVEKASGDRAVDADPSETTIPLLKPPAYGNGPPESLITCESIGTKDPKDDLNISQSNSYKRPGDTENNGEQTDANNPTNDCATGAVEYPGDEQNRERNDHERGQGANEFSKPGCDIKPVTQTACETESKHGYLLAANTAEERLHAKAYSTTEAVENLKKIQTDVNSTTNTLPEVTEGFGVTQGKLPSVSSESDTEKQVCRQTDNTASQQEHTLTLNDQTKSSHHADKEKGTTESHQEHSSSSNGETMPSEDDPERNIFLADSSSSLQHQSNVENRVVELEDGWIPVDKEDCNSELSQDDGAAHDIESTSIDKPCEQDKELKDRPKQNLLFYQNKVRCLPDEMFIDEIHSRWKDDFDLLERRHAYIQWLFPNHQNPARNPKAQKLYRHEAEGIQEDKEAFDRLKRSYEMMLNFYGLRLISQETGEVERAHNWKDRFANLQSNKHNNLRISRILLCLGEMGLEHYKAPLVRHILHEACDGNLRGTLHSCRKFWIESIDSETEKTELRELYENAMKVNSGSWFSRLLGL